MANESIQLALERLLAERVRVMREVRGGEIGNSLYVETSQAQYFVKYRSDLDAEVFVCEAAGLDALRQAGGLAVPQTYYAGSIPEQAGGMIVLQWVEPGEPTSETAEHLGRGLAAVHRTRHITNKFGFATDNFIGKLRQSNRQSPSWLDFYREQRLEPMIRLADEHGCLPERRRTSLSKLLESLDRYIPDDRQPGLLHGDLWSGNWLTGADGDPYLIDPAAYYGDREVDIAFSELFGGFPARFYEAYKEAYPLPQEYEERRPLYQLFYLLVHLIHFGEAYGPAVDRILNKYG